MLMLLVINTLILTGKGGVFQLACIVVISLLLMLQRRWRAALALTLCMGVILVAPQIATLTDMPSAVMMLLAAFMFARPYIIAGFMGYYFFCATTPSLLIAGMYRLHMPRAVIIPLVVMMRFFPVLSEEQRAIRSAMLMRGLPGRGGILLHPWRTLECILIPLIGITLRTGDVLSASALSRGLGHRAIPSSILSLRFTPLDLLLGILCTGLVTLFFSCGGY